MNHEDDLIDALLKEQARKRDADEALLSRIDDALDGGGEARQRTSTWKRVLPLSAAAAIAIGGAAIYYNQAQEDTPLAINEMRQMDRERSTTGVPEDPMAMKALPREAPPAPPSVSSPKGIASNAESALQAVPADGLDRIEEELKKAPARAPVVEPVPIPVPEVESPSLPLVDEAAFGTDSGGGGAAPLAGRGLAEREQIRRQAVVPATNDTTRYKKELEAPRDGSTSRDRLEQPAHGGFGDLDRDNYGQLVDQPWKSPWQDPLSTFSVDVDTASYTNLRRMIREGRAIQPDAVRIEECINYFDYKYPAPEGENPFAVNALLATCPWQPEHLLARVAIKGREIHENARPPSNLVFLIDVSGSMQSPDKLPMLKRSMETLIGSLDERDRVGIVVYAGTEGVVLEPTTLDDDGKAKALAAVSKLESGGSTNGGAGLYRAYQMALRNKFDGGVNRVILATDGDFNVGTTGQGELVKLVKAEAAKGVNLSVLGFGTGNLNDAMLEAITNDGNGNYFYVDGDNEANRIFQTKLTGTLVTIAKDVKIQIEFNPGKVKAYRLIGYANRVLRNQDFRNDKVDAGDIGAGHTVTAFYEVVPVGADGPDTGEVDGLNYQKPADRKELVPSDDWLTLKLRYKHPEGDVSREITTPVKGEPVDWKKAEIDYRMASAVALFGMKLREMPEVADITWDQVIEIAKPALADDLEERRAEFIELVKMLK